MSNSVENESLRKVQEVFQSKETRQIIHQVFSTNCFNNCWNFIDKGDLTDEETEDMLLLSSASLFHWKQREDCQPMNLSVAYWQLGRVNCMAGNTEIARHYGNKVVCLSQEKGLSPFSMGYGYEVLLNVAILESNSEDARKYLELARAELDKIEDKDELELLKTDIDKLEARLQDIIFE